MQTLTAVFDLGKVLVDFDYASVAGKLAQHTDAGTETVDRVIHDWGLLVEYETGQITTAQFFDRFRDETGFRAGADVFAEQFGDIFTPLDATIDLLHRLKERRVPLCLFSNTNPLAVRFVRARFPFFAWFDSHVFSFEHGSMKPDEPLYAVVEKQTCRRGADLFFLDDRPENIQTALNRGWQGHVFVSATSAETALIRAGMI